ncbi:TNR [Branchiostoma lanceolatum]|uniref:TNR protein n=1 Tax=Branchiostoma lanceolatum TaxID=7740 RepID=A0A8K0F2M8_BRALA|nr:TNR [Branchiostoma lanceolatum]
MKPNVSVVLFLLVAGLCTCVRAVRYDSEEEGLLAMEEQAEKEAVRNKRLYFHSINTYYLVEHSTQCAQLCRLTSDCKSYQYRQAEQRCEINNATMREFPLDSKTVNGWSYYKRNAIAFFGIWSPCNPRSDPCRNGGICTSRLLKTPQTQPNSCRPTCVCPAGFHGEDCQTDERFSEDGWKQHGWYAFKVFTDAPKTYTKARAACTKEGATLGILKDQETHDFVVSLRNLQAPNRKVWIGLNDKENEGSFVWEDGSPMGGFSPWYPGQPGRTENPGCVFISPQGAPHPNQWGDRNCTRKSGYVCQKRLSSWSSVEVVGSSGSSWADDVAYGAGRTEDGNPLSHWRPMGSDRDFNNWYVIYDIGNSSTVTKISLTNYGDTVHDVSAFRLQTSSNCGQYGWTDVMTVDDVEAGTRQAQEFGGFAASARYWRLIVTGTHSGWPPFLVEAGFPELSETDLVPVYQTCQTVDTESGGEIRNPQHPKPSSVSCEALVTVGRGKRVQLTFRDPFSVEPQSDCRFDYVELFEYVDDKWESLGKFCGRSRPRAVTRSTGNVVKVIFHADDNIASLFSVAWQPEGVNVAVGKTARQTSDSSRGVASRAVDGNTNTDFGSGGSCTHTAKQATPSWWVDLGQSYMVRRVVIFNRMDCCGDRLNPFNIHIGDSAQVSENPKCGGDHQIDVSQSSISVSCQGMQGRYVGVRLPGSSRVLSLCEVQVFSSTYDDRRGWKRHGLSAFKVFTDTLKTHGDAKAACAAEDGATLAIVKDQATLDFIASLQNQQADGIANVYIGLNEITSEGNYVWEDGSDIGNFHPWEPGQPNNYRGNEDCFWMTGPSNANPHTWNDISCSSLAGYVCQKTFIGTCQVVASGSGGEVQSPQYPEPSDVSCESLVTVARGQRAELTFSSFSVEAHANCGKDYVELFDSVGDSWKSLGKFCGSTPPDTICSAGSAVKIVFHTDQGIPSSFSVAWQPKDAIFSNEALAGCSAPYVAEAITCPQLTAPSNGTMTSGHGHSYRDEVQFTCEAGFILGGAPSVSCRADGRWTSMLPTCTSCQSPLGMESGDIPDSDVTASSISSPQYSSHYGRLNGVLGEAAWCAGQQVRGQWLQVYLGVMAVSGVITQGRDQSDQRVTSYTLHFGWDGTTFAPYKNQDLSDRVFEGPSDRTTPVTHLLDVPVVTKYVRFVIETWEISICMRTEVLGCRNVACLEPLGMEDRSIPDSSITASSVRSVTHKTYHGRLNSLEGQSAWVARVNERGQWLQIDLDGTAVVHGVVTQGRATYDQWVTSYKLEHSWNGRSWTTITDTDGSDKIFTGNADRSTPVTHILRPPVAARYVRFVVQTFISHMSMRVEVLGCRDEGESVIVQRGSVLFYSSLFKSTLSIYHVRFVVQSLHRHISMTVEVLGCRDEVYSSLLYPHITSASWCRHGAGTSACGSRCMAAGMKTWHRHVSMQVEVHGCRDEVYSSLRTLSIYHVRFVVQSFPGHISMAVEVLGCRDEGESVIVQRGSVLFYSRIFKSTLSIYHVRFVVQSFPGHISMRVELLDCRDEGLAIVSGVITQGRENLVQWVTSYKLQFSTGGAPGTWTTYQDSEGFDMVFTGNTDNTTPVRHVLQSPVTTRYVRFVAVTWHGWISMRVEVLGCYHVGIGPRGPAILPEDCKDIQLSDPDLPSGPYTVYPGDSPGGLLVYCDMDTDGGGWTVFQRRQDGSVDFYLDWNKYKEGFPSSSVSGEFWLGNDNIHRLTSQKAYELRVDLEAVDGVTAYAVYDTFSVGDESDKYRLSVGGFSGTAGDSMAKHDGKPFSTKDSDNDPSNLHCAVSFTGAWWYDACQHANLNGAYGDDTYGKGINWFTFRGHTESLKFTEMKIRPRA